jgi:voltage-gated potassium channel
MSASGKESLRKKLETVIFGYDTPAGRMFDVVLFWFIGASLVIVLLESIPGLRLRFGRVFFGLEWLFTVLFIIEYGFRIYSSSKRGNYIGSFFGLVDLLSLLPSFFGLLVAGAGVLRIIRILRFLRIIRVLKLTRLTQEGNFLMRALIRSRAKIGVFLLSVGCLVFILGTLMYVIEGEASGFTSIPISIYWAIVTLTTVGYGDISPVTPLGRALSSLVMIIGYAVIAVPTGIVTYEMAAEKHGRKCEACGETGLKARAVYCSKCGKKLPDTF